MIFAWCALVARRRCRREETHMRIDRLTGFAPLVRDLADTMCSLPEPCIGCEDCNGMCRELIEVVTLPDAVQKKKDR